MKGLTGHAQEGLNMTNGWLDKNLNVWRKEVYSDVSSLFQKETKSPLGGLSSRDLNPIIGEWLAGNDAAEGDQEDKICQV